MNVTMQSRQTKQNRAQFASLNPTPQTIATPPEIRCLPLELPPQSAHRSSQLTLLRAPSTLSALEGGSSNSSPRHSRVVAPFVGWPLEASSKSAVRNNTRQAQYRQKCQQDLTYLRCISHLCSLLDPKAPKARNSKHRNFKARGLRAPSRARRQGHGIKQAAGVFCWDFRRWVGSLKVRQNRGYCELLLRRDLCCIA